MPKISILLSNYNNSKYLKTAIDSVIKQTYTDWELVLLDDGSTDDSETLINGYKNEQRIHYFKNKKNIGRINSLRKMIKLAKAEIVGILDSDDALAEDALEEIMQLYNNADPGMVYSQAYYCDENLKPVHLGFSAAIPKGASNLHLHCAHHLRTFKKNFFYKTTGYDDETLTAEDFDIVLKIEEIADLVYIDKVLYFYRILPSSHSHGFINIKINRSSAALAKLNAYKRRFGTEIPNLNKSEICEVLFLGSINAFLALRFRLAIKFLWNLFIIDHYFLINKNFYKAIFSKVKKIYYLKKEKPLIKI